MGGRADLLQLLGSPTNRAILAHLAIEPLYTRRVAQLVGLSEPETSRRLRAFERHGILSAEWANLGKTVRLYRLAHDSLRLKLTGQGIEVEGHGAAPVIEEASMTPPGATPLVGRAQELSALRAMTAEGGRLCVHGIGGVGKTALVASLAAEWPGPVAWRTASPDESGALLLHRLAATMRLHAPSREPDEPEALTDWLARVASLSRTLLVLDRAEVASASAVESFVEVAGRMQRGAAIVVARAFPSPLPRSYASFELGGISRESAHDLLASTGARAERIDALHARVGGHPLSLLLARNALDVESDASAFLENGLRDFLVQDVLAQLPEGDRDALLALCILEVPFAEEEAAEVAAIARPRDTLLRLAARGLVVRGPEGWLVHDVIRSALAGEAPPRAHRLAAQALDAFEDPARGLEALRHVLAAADGKLGLALTEREATERRHRYAEHGLAPTYAGLLDKMTKLASAPRHRAAILIERAHLAPFTGGDGAVSLEQARAFVPISGPLKARYLFECAAQARREGDDARAVLLLDDVATWDAPARLLADALLERAMLAEERERGGALSAFEAALAAAERADDPRLLALAYAGAARARQWATGDGRAWAEEALRLARLSGHLRGEAMARTTLTEPSLDPKADITLVHSGHEHASATLDIARRLGDPWLLACALTDVGILAARLGDMEEADRAGREGMQAAGAVGSSYLRAGSAVAVADALVATGKAEEARALLIEAIEAHEEHVPDPSPMFSIVWYALARACSAAGDPEGAAAARRRAAHLVEQRPAAP